MITIGPTLAKIPGASWLAEKVGRLADWTGGRVGRTIFAGIAIGVGAAFTAVAISAAITYVAGLGTYGAITAAGEAGGGGYAANNVVRNQLNNAPQRAYEIMGKVLQNGGKLNGFVSKPWLNKGSQLPTNANYFEHDIYPFIQGVNRGVERLIFGNNGSVYFTPDHYDTFIKLK